MKPLDRMAVEEAGPNPQRLAEAIHRQINLATGSVPVAEIARALDIIEIKRRRCEALKARSSARSTATLGGSC